MCRCIRWCMVGYSMQTVLTAWRLENKLRYASMTLLDIHDDIICIFGRSNEPQHGNENSKPRRATGLKHKYTQAVGGRPPRYASSPCKLTIASYLFARWHLFRHVGYLRHQQQVDLWPFDLETGVRVTYDVGYLCQFVFLGLPVLELGPMYVTDRRQTSDKSIA